MTAPVTHDVRQEIARLVLLELSTVAAVYAHDALRRDFDSISITVRFAESTDIEAVEVTSMLGGLPVEGFGR